MALSSDLVSQFVQVTKPTNTNTETTVYGTICISHGKKYVKLDGSNLLTPISLTADAIEGERVTVMIKNHRAIVTGNISSPAARVDDVNAINLDVAECERLMANKVDAERLEAEVARIDTLIVANAEITGRLEANEIKVEEVAADNVIVKDKLSATEADIDKLTTDKLDAALAKATYATITNLDATNGRIYNLESTYGEFHDIVVTYMDATQADIDKLSADKLDATSAEVMFANIDFSNIGEAAIEKIFSDSGIIKDLIVSDGKITGELVGVTIKGDLIEGNTIVADKLVVKGEDGLYYKLNTDGVTTEAEQTDYNSLNGTVIQAKSITAEKIAVDDLVAFGATIGGFNITENALYSDVKDGPLNTTRGVYFDDDGQFSVGDSEQYVRYYKDDLDNYKLEISASSTVLTGTNENVEEVLNTLREDVDHAQETAGTAQETADNAESLIKQLSDSISTLVTDGNGTSLMVQTDDGWTFSTADLQKTVDATSEGLDSLVNELGSTNNVIDILQQAVDDLGVLTDYIKIGTYENEPCIELGESDSDFKLRITNTRIIFMEGSDMPAYFTNQSMHIKKAVIEEELQQGGFVWTVRSNGNMGLVWKGVSS